VHGSVLSETCVQVQEHIYILTKSIQKSQVMLVLLVWVFPTEASDYIEENFIGKRLWHSYMNLHKGAEYMDQQSAQSHMQR